MTQPRHILVTSALPYANNSLHLGHVLEYVQTDIWVRFQRMRGHRCVYVCASDAHGTPTMLRAEERGITPEALIDEVSKEHERDFATFRISVDNYLTTHSPENRELTTSIYERLRDAGHITRRVIKQAYDEHKQMFLPDRYVRGTCPLCGAPDQYGDSCENCSATYSPLELEDAVSVVSGTVPTVRESEHLFFRLGDFEAELREWMPGHVDTAMARKLDEWFSAGLKDWDISRDEPYFGFAVPGEPGKYFYVWFDAPIGYMASFLNLCRREDLDFGAYWGAESRAELYHFIGKDIVYFHTLFWPSVLSGAGYRKPSGVFVHGFLTVNGQKMSKSRGTFITAARLAEALDPDYLRYYFAAKLGPTAEDIDFNFEDFVAKVNSDLVGKLVNIASRCAGFVHRLNDGLLSERLPEEALHSQFAAAGSEIADAFERRDYARAVRSIMALADRANRYIDDEKPWIAAKDPARREQVLEVCTLGLNLFRTLMIYLKPVLPGLAERAERFLEVEPLAWSDAATPLLGRRIAPYQALLQRVDLERVRAITGGLSEGPNGPAARAARTDTETTQSRNNEAHSTKTRSTEAQGSEAQGINTHGTKTQGANTEGAKREAIAQPPAEKASAEIRLAGKPSAAEQIDIELFAKLDLRVARVIEASFVEGADKLLKLALDVGDERRVVFAGIRSAYEPAALIGRLVVLVANLKPRKMRFGTSEGMVLAASGGREIFLLSPDAGAEPGMKVS